MTRFAKLLRPLLAALTAGLLTAGASAQTVNVVSTLDGFQQGSGSSATGTGTGVADLGALTLTFDLSFSGLGSPQTFGHIHFGATGQNGPVFFNFGNGQQTGTVWNMDQFEMDELLAGNLYFNLHSQQLPGGEIRGQITIEPETYCLCNAGPCGNDNAAGGCENNTGSGASLSVSGQASVGLDTLALTANGVPANQFGIFYMGPNQIANAFGNGTRCVGGNVFRFPLTNSGSSGSITLGPGIAAFTAANFPANGQIAAGDVWNVQCWYRDPGGPCGASFNLSEAVAVQWTP